MSLINFEQSIDVIKETASLVSKENETGESLVYLNSMVMPSDKEMIKEIKKRTGLSEGQIVREIFNQWRQFLLEKHG
jgi:hypothetical protein